MPHQNALQPRPEFPDKWRQDCEGAGARVEIQIPDSWDAGPNTFPSDVWVEIPTTSVQLWETRAENVGLKRTAKVEFPVEWGEETGEVVTNSPRELLSAYATGTGDNKIALARVWLEHPSGKWVLKHLGWINGVGSGEKDGTSKMWVYDFADLIEHIPANETFNHPTLKEALSNIIEEIRTRAPVPIEGGVIQPPESADEARQFLKNIGRESLAGLVKDDPPNGAYYEEFAEAFGGSVINTGPNLPVDGLNSKSFRPNHDTVVDMFKWYEEKSGCRLHFEPAASEQGVILVADVEPEMHIFADTNVLAAQQERNLFNPEGSSLHNFSGRYEFHEAIEVLNNNALYQINPPTSLLLRGDVASGVKPPVPTMPFGIDFILDNAYGVEDTEPPAKKFPVVRAYVPSLVQAAEGDLQPQVIESEATTLDAAKREAKRKLANMMRKEGEGQIIIRGMPKIGPNDAVDAFEQCGSFVQYEQNAARYRVNEVKHVKKAGEQYKSELRVGIWADESQIELDARMETMKGGSE